MTELDLVFICDTTGSMGSYLNAAKKSIEKIVTTITQSEKCDVRFALVEYRDHPPQDSSFAFRLTDFTASMKEIQRAVNQMSAQGGGDGPESVACAFHCASELKYREKATKVAVWIADAPPHGFSPNSGDGFEKGCPCGHDFIEVVHDFMKKELYFSYLRTLMRAVAEMTGGQYAALASADVLGDLITAGAIEEIQINKMLVEVQERLMHNPEFVALNPKEKEIAIKKHLTEAMDKTEITSVEIDSIFSVEPEAVPDIFKNAENLKQLKKEMVKQKDIVVEFKDGYDRNSGSLFMDSDSGSFDEECLSYSLDDEDSIEYGRGDDLLGSFDLKECDAISDAILLKNEEICENCFCEEEEEEEVKELSLCDKKRKSRMHPVREEKIPTSRHKKNIMPSAAPVVQEVKTVKRKANVEQATRMETRMKNFFS
ncbi:VWFA domain-containing protein [Entamoeba marina]